MSFGSMEGDDSLAIGRSSTSELETVESTDCENDRDMYILGASTRDVPWTRTPR